MAEAGGREDGAGGGGERGPQTVDLQDLVLAVMRDHAIFALDGHGRIASWNSGAERLTGYQAKEVLGKSFTHFGEPDARQPLAAVLSAARSSGVFAQERWWRRRDGTLVLIDEHINPLDDSGAELSAGYVVIARDLTDREVRREEVRAGQAREERGATREQQLRSELQAAERRAAFLAEASSILVASAINFDTTVRSLARLAVSRLGDWCIVHALDAQGELHCIEAAHRDPRKETALSELVERMIGPEWLDPLRSVLRTGQAQVLDHLPDVLFRDLSEDDRTRLLDSSIAPTSAMVAPLLGRGRVLGALTLIAAESRRAFDAGDVELAEELGRRAAIAMDNARLYREAQEANRAKADFLAVMSHELRTPLNAIMGYTDLMDAEVSGPLSDHQRAQVGRIRTSARHLLQLIEEILSFARTEAGGEELKVSLVRPDEVIEEVRDAAEPLAEAKGLAFEVEIADAETEIETDPMKLRQALVNLLSNAVKFTESGTVWVRFRRDGDWAVFEVSDTGIGIPHEQQAKIFDPFWQVERPNTRRVGGTGLGLSVARRYARLLRGDVSVESEPGQGARFLVRVPLRLPRGRKFTAAL